MSRTAQILREMGMSIDQYAPETKDAELPASAPQDAASTEAMPLLISAREAARLCGVALRTWHRLDSAGMVPAAVWLGGRKLWQMRELADWAAAGCPARSEWDWRPEP